MRDAETVREALRKARATHARTGTARAAARVNALEIELQAALQWDDDSAEAGRAEAARLRALGASPATGFQLPPSPLQAARRAAIEAREAERRQQDETQRTRERLERERIHRDASRLANDFWAPKK